MLTFLHILQIVGIILLVLLGIVIALILIILFDPIRYKLLLNYDAYIENDDEKSNYCYLKLKWLLNVVTCKVDIGLKGIDYDFRIFGFKSNLLDKYLFDKSDSKNEDDINDYLDDKKSQEEDINEENIVSNLNDQSDEDVENVENNSDETAINTEEESKELLDEIEEIWEDLVSDDENEENVYENNSSKKGLKGFFRNLKHIDFKRLTLKNFVRELKKVFLRIIHTIRDIIKAIYKSVKKICEKYNLIADLWNKKSTQAAITRIKDYISKLCKSILPKKKSINIDLGFEDPAYTGIALAFMGSLYGLIGETLKVNPNFEDKECRVNCKFIGKMRVFSLGIIIIKIMRDKAIKRLISNIDKLKEDLSNE